MSAIDAKAMYPAQKEGNNIDKSAMVIAEDMSYIIKHQNDFGIEKIEARKLIDMYSPYKNEDL